MIFDQEHRWRICSRKYDGSFHRLWTCAYPQQMNSLFSDEFTPHLSLLIPARTKVVEASGKNWSSPYDVIACFFAEKYYQVMVLLKEGGTEYYCNSCTIAKIDEIEREVNFVDLDIDLLVDASGAMRVVDQQEFEDNKFHYQYPAPVVASVLRDLDDLQKMASNRLGVFSHKAYE